MRRHSLAAVDPTTAVCRGSAGGDEVSADGPLGEHLFDWADEVDNAREMAQLVTDEFWETFSVMHGQLVAVTTKLRVRADEAN